MLKIPAAVSNPNGTMPKERVCPLVGDNLNRAGDPVHPCVAGIGAFGLKCVGSYFRGRVSQTPNRIAIPKTGNTQLSSTWLRYECIKLKFLKGIGMMFEGGERYLD